MKDDGGGEDKVRHGRRRTKEVRGRRKEGGMTEGGRNGWMGERKKRERKPCKMGDTKLKGPVRRS